jgi:hypothetical protein
MGTAGAFLVQTVSVSLFRSEFANVVLAMHVGIQASINPRVDKDIKRKALDRGAGYHFRPLLTE